VAAGVFKPGDLIPSVRAQALALVVNPNTVQRAYQELEREGLIESRKGLGMVVAADSKSAAQNGVEESARAAFVQAIRGAVSAGRSRSAIDRLYRDAWDELNKPGAAT
jgi:GntR family transcriptional regulator